MEEKKRKDSYQKMSGIGVLTRDCAGVNAALRAVVRTAAHYDIEVMGSSPLLWNRPLSLKRSILKGIIA